jgi:hypothetical protein
MSKQPSAAPPAVSDIERQMKLGNALVASIKNNNTSGLIRDVSDNRLPMQALVFAEGQIGLKRVVEAFTQRHRGSTPLHAAFRSGSWQLARYLAQKFDRVTIATLAEDETGVSPLQSLAMRPAPKAATPSAAEEEQSWMNTYFSEFSFAQLERRCMFGNCTLHYLALRERGETYDRIREQYPDLASCVNQHGRRPADMRLAQREHDVLAERVEVTVLRDALARSEQKLRELTLAEQNQEHVSHLKTHADNAAAQLDALRATSIQQENDRVSVQQRQLSVETERNGLRLRVQQLEKEREASQKEIDRLTAGYRDVMNDLEEKKAAYDELAAASQASAQRILALDCEIASMDERELELRTALERRTEIERQHISEREALANEQIAAVELQERQNLVNERALAAARIAEIADAEERKRAAIEADARAVQAELDHQRKINQQRQTAAEKREAELKKLVAQQQEETQRVRSASEAHLKKLQADRERDLAECAQLSTKLTAHMAEIEAKRKEAEQAHTEAKLLAMRLEEADADRAQASQQIEQLRQESTELRRLHLEMQRTSSETQAEMSRQREALRAQLADMQQMLEAARQDAEQQKRTAEQAARTQSEQNAETRAQLNSEVDRTGKLEAQLRLLEAQLHERQQRFTSAEQSIIEQRVLMQRTEQEAAEARAIAAATEERLRAASRALDSERIKTQRQLSTIEEQQRQLSGLVNSPSFGSATNTPRKPGTGAGADEVTPSNTSSPRTSGHASSTSLSLKRGTTLRRGVGSTTSATNAVTPAGSLKMQSRVLADAERERAKRETAASSTQNNAKGDFRFFAGVELIVQTGDVAKMRRLIEDYEFNVNHTTPDGDSYLALAIRAASKAHTTNPAMLGVDEKGHKEMLKKLTDMIEFLIGNDCCCPDIDNMANDLNLPLDIRKLIDDRDDYSPFCQALLSNNPAKAIRYCEGVTDVNRVPGMFRGEKSSYLHLAVQCARSDNPKATPSTSMVELLCVRLGASARVVDANQRTPLHLALYKKIAPHDRQQIVRYLMAANADPGAVCSYKPLLDHTRSLLSKKPTYAAPTINGHNTATRGGAGSLQGWRQRLMRTSPKKTEEAKRQERMTEAQQYGTPFAMAQALGDPVIIEMLTKPRYRPVSLDTQTTMVIESVEFQSNFLACRDAGLIRDTGHLNALCERYRYAFYRFSPYLQSALGGYFNAFTRLLQKVAGVLDSDPDKEMESKLTWQIEQDLLFFTLLESRGRSMMSAIDRAARATGALPTDDDTEFDEHFEYQLAMLVAIAEDDKYMAIVDWLSSAKTPEARRETRHNILELARTLVRDILSKEGMADNETDAKIQRETASLQGNELREYFDRMDQTVRADYDKRRMMRNADRLYKVLTQLIKFANAMLQRSLDVEDMIAAPAQNLYSDAVAASVRHFIERNAIEELQHMMQRSDLLYGELETETIIDNENNYSGVEYAAHCGAVRALEWFLSFRPQRVEEIGSCNKSLTAIAAQRDHPLVCVAIDYFLVNNPYWRANRVHVTDHPNIQFYQHETRNGMNVLQLAKQQSRPDLLQFCIGCVPVKVANLNPSVDMRETITTFRSEQDRSDYRRCIEILQAAHDQFTGVSRSPSSTPVIRSPPPPSTNNAPFISATAPGSGGASRRRSVLQSLPASGEAAALLSAPPSLPTMTRAISVNRWSTLELDDAEVAMPPPSALAAPPALPAPPTLTATPPTKPEAATKSLKKKKKKDSGIKTHTSSSSKRASTGEETGDHEEVEMVIVDT